MRSQIWCAPSRCAFLWCVVGALDERPDVLPVAGRGLIRLDSAVAERLRGALASAIRDGPRAGQSGENENRESHVLDRQHSQAGIVIA